MFSSPPGLTGSALIAGLAGVLLVPLGAPAQAAEVDLEARTHSTSAFPNARGHAGYERDGGGREFRPGLAGVRALAGHRVTCACTAPSSGARRWAPRDGPTWSGTPGSRA